MDLSQRHRSSPRLSRHNRTRELEINRADPKRLVAFDTQFLQQLRQLPDQLEQLQRYFDSGTKSTRYTKCKLGYYFELQSGILHFVNGLV